MNEDGDSQGRGRGQTPPEPDLQQLARDWITLWQSELAAMAVDREAQETWHSLLSLWAGAATAILQAAPRPPSDAWARRQPWTEPAPRPAAAAAAPDPRDAEIERLARRIAQLEARLAELERRPGSHRPSPRRRQR